MQKLHVNRVLGRKLSSGLQSPDLFIRQISTSAPHAQEPRQDPHGLPTRREQPRDITDRVDLHFRRFDSGSYKQNQRPDSGRHEQNQRPAFPSEKRPNLNAVDARDLAAPPNSASRPSQRSTDGDGASVFRSPLDALNLGSQRPENKPLRIRFGSQRPENNFSRIKYVSKRPENEFSRIKSDPQRPENDFPRIRLGSQRPENDFPHIRFGSQRPENDFSRIRTDPMSRPDRPPRDFQRSPISARRDTSDKQYQGGTTSSQQNRSRAPPGANPRKPRSGGPTGSKNRERAPRSNFSGVGRSKQVGHEPTEEEIEYLRSRDNVSTYGDMIYKGGSSQHIGQGHSGYKPRDISADTLQGMGPALACGEWGMNETIGERLIQINEKQDEYNERVEELAQKVGEGEFCQFWSKQEKVDTMKTVERNLAGQGENAKLDEEQEKEKTALVDARMAEERAKLATRLLKGDYYVGLLGKGPTAQLLERYTQKNETYMPRDSKALAGKIQTLLPFDGKVQGSRVRP
ncbi:MAG: hypothetical protein Q9221_004614 [Calogaya cf. arnoldii]